MLCENCGKREANVRYSENINGVKKEMHLCEECSRKLGISSKMDFSMPSLDIPSFFGSFLEDFSTPEFMPFLNEVKQLTCDSCGSTFEDIINSGRYGCANCYDVFEDRMDPILKKLQGANRHNGRLGKISDNKVKFEEAGMRFAPIEVARLFGREHTIPETEGVTPFLFHKWWGENRDFPKFENPLTKLWLTIKAIRRRLMFWRDWS